MFVLICYDTPDDGRRVRMVRALEGYGQRVQRSVWECDVTPRQWERLHRLLNRAIDADEDPVRCYHLCEACVPRVEGMGRGDRPPARTPTFWLV